MTEKITSTTDPDAGMFIKGEYERQFAYKAHTACNKCGFVLGVEVTAGNIHDSVAWDAVYNDITSRFERVKYIAMDAGYKHHGLQKRFWRMGDPILNTKGIKNGTNPGSMSTIL